jgi:hypothetical protein
MYLTKKPEGQFYDAESHLLLGTGESVKLLAQMAFDLSLRGGDTLDKGYWITRSVLQLLLLGKVGDAIVCFSTFQSHLGQETPAVEGTDLLSYPLYNFTLLLLQVLQKDAVDQFSNLVTLYGESLSQDSFLQEVSFIFSYLFLLVR